MQLFPTVLALVLLNHAVASSTPQLRGPQPDHTATTEDYVLATTTEDHHVLATTTEDQDLTTTLEDEPEERDLQSMDTQLFCSRFDRKKKKCKKQRNVCTWLAADKICMADPNGSAPSATINSANVLFVGDSFTYVNKMALEIFPRLARSLGKNVQVSECGRQPSVSLQGHLHSQISIDAIASKPSFSHIVLQEQSMLLSLTEPHYRRIQSVQFADEWADIIKSKQAKAVMFETWAYSGGYFLGDTYADMQTRLGTGYSEFNDALRRNGVDSEIAHVGEAWRKAFDQYVPNQFSVLYRGDGRHPEDGGSYLAALTIYCTIFNDSPVNAKYKPKGMKKSIARQLQRYAWETCQENNNR